MASILKDQIALQRQNSHTYTVGYSMEWAMGPMLLGGCVAAAIYSTAQLHFNSTLAAQGQPDVHTIHFEFFKPCSPEPSTIQVTDLKIGKGSSFIQLDLFQKGDKKCTALATSTDFTVPLGPTAKTDFTFLPPPRPLPNFRKVEALEPDDNWIPSKTLGDLLPFLKHLTFLYPIDSQPNAGTIDYWCAFDRPEIFSPAHLTLLSDVAPSASDTLLRTEGVFDAHRIHRLKKQVADETPGQPAILRPTLQEAAKAKIWNTTLNLDLQFKRRMPEREMLWTFTRVTTRMLEGGRMDLDLTICDQELRPVLLARQVMLVINAERRWKNKSGQKSRATKI